VAQPVAAAATADAFRPVFVSDRIPRRQRNSSSLGLFALSILSLGFGYILGQVIPLQRFLSPRETEKLIPRVVHVPAAPEKTATSTTSQKGQPSAVVPIRTYEQSTTAKVNRESGPKTVSRAPVTSGYGNAFELVSVHAEPSEFNKDQTTFRCTVKVRNTSRRALTTLIRIHLYDIAEEKIASSGLVKSNFTIGETRTVSTILLCPNDKVDFVDAVKADVKASF